MLITYKTIFSIVFLIAFRCFAIEISCPDKIQTQQNIITIPEENWSAFEDPANGQTPLEGFQVFDGHPKNEASLVPTGIDQEKRSYWEQKSSKGLWISCFYYQSKIRLIRPIVGTYKRCTTNYKRNSAAARKIWKSLICH